MSQVLLIYIISILISLTKGIIQHCKKFRRIPTLSFTINDITENQRLDSLCTLDSASCVWIIQITTL